MDKKKLIEHLKAWFSFAEDSDPDWCYLAEIKVLNEIIRLISAHGGEAEVRDGEREKLEKWFDHVYTWFDSIRGDICSGSHNDKENIDELEKEDEKCAEQIRAILRQRRTVSREWVEMLADYLAGQRVPRIEQYLCEKLAELGIEVEP